MSRSALRILVLMHPQLVPPDSLKGQSAEDINTWKTEFDVVSTLRALGHEARPLGVQWDLRPLKDTLDEFKPDIVFNMLEEFHGEGVFDHNVVSFLELMKVPYTGCNPRGLVISRGKALAKKLLAYHRIRVPEFAVFPAGRKVRRPTHLRFPLIVKSLTEHASVGISQNSIVDSDDKLAERVKFVHDRIQTDAIAEQFIEGRELYVAVIGNDRLTTFHPWELVVEHRQDGAPLIATAKVKHDLEYQERHGIAIRAAHGLSDEQLQKLSHDCKRIYRTLELSGYARLDFRLDANGHFYFLEANPNPEIAQNEEFAQSALHAGVTYPELLQRILRIGLKRDR